MRTKRPRGPGLRVLESHSRTASSRSAIASHRIASLASSREPRNQDVSLRESTGICEKKKNRSASRILHCKVLQRRQSRHHSTEQLCSRTTRGFARRVETIRRIRLRLVKVCVCKYKHMYFHVLYSVYCVNLCVCLCVCV